MGEVTIQQLMDRLPGAFIPQNATGIDAVMYFDLSGAQGGQWTVTIRDEKIQVERWRAFGSTHIDLAGGWAGCVGYI